MTINKYRINYIFLLLFIIFSFLSPGVSFKYGVYIIYFFYTGITFLYRPFNFQLFEKITLILLFFYPITSSILLYIITSVPLPFEYLTQYYMVVFFVISSKILKAYYFKIISATMGTIFYTSLFVLLLNILLIFDIYTHQIHQTFYGIKGVSIDDFVGLRPSYQPIVAKLYVSTAILFVLGGVYYLFISKIFNSFLIFVTLLIIGARFPAIIMGLSYFIYFLFHSNFKQRVMLAFIILPIFIVLDFFYVGLFERTVLAMDWSSDSSGVSARKLIAMEVFELADSLSVILGKGSGSYFYSDFRSGYIDNIEISHLELIRRFGLVWFIGFNIYLLYILVLINRTKNRTVNAVSCAIIAFYISALSNPVLMHPIFIMLIIFTGIYCNNLIKERGVK